MIIYAISHMGPRSFIPSKTTISMLDHFFPHLALIIPVPYLPFPCLITLLPTFITHHPMMP
jgi:hypothetical protein